MNILNQLINQAKSPEGFIGKTMIHIMNLVHDKRTRWGIDKVYIKEDATVLDIGCGGGNTITLLTKRLSEGKVFGIDYAEDCVDTTVKKNIKAVTSGAVEVMKASVSELPFSEKSFDLVTAIQTHYFWPDLENDISEVYRVLKEKGVFLIVSEHYKIRYHMNRYNTVKDLETLLYDIKFREVKVFEENGWLCLIGVK